MKVLVTGATGYVGGRLIPLLLKRGHAVRVLVRDPRRVMGRQWARQVDIYAGDVLQPASLTPALRGLDAAFYLVHSMYGRGDFATLDATGARNFAAAVKGTTRDAPSGQGRDLVVIYLGGLVPRGNRASKHLASRAEVGAILRDGLATTELRAGPIIGSGSASFEMVRYLTERLPAMIAPRWILNPVQPIAVDDILEYLVLALEIGPLGVIEVGGEPLTFQQMMERYASVRGLRRLILPVRVLAPGLAAKWVQLVTPIPNRLAVPLIQGVVHPVLADTTRAREQFPSITPVSYEEAVRRALEQTNAGLVETRWSGALHDGPSYEFKDWEGLTREVRTMHLPLPPESVFRAFCSIGGDRGWLVWGWAWRLRGAIDRAVGGPGLRRGRRDPWHLLAGEALDFWRVEAVEAPRLLRLRAEMRLPGRAWLQWEALSERAGTRLVQTASFAPSGLAGALYWYVLYPLHRRIFSDLLRAVGRLASELPAPDAQAPSVGPSSKGG